MPLPNDPVRVLFVAPSAYLLGGVQTWLAYLLPALEAFEFEVHLALVEGNRHNPQAYIEAHDFHRWRAVVPRQFTPSGRCHALVKTLEAVRPDIVIGVNIADLYPAALEARRRGLQIRVAATHHALQADCFADFARFEGVIDAVVCTNQLSAMLCQEISRFPPDRVLYAPYGVVDPGLPYRSPAPGGRMRIGFAGRLEDPQKRASDLSKIFAAVVLEGVDAELEIAGTGPGEKPLRQAFNELGLSDRVRFLGHVPADRMSAEFYARIDALLITSTWETGPIVAWEAMIHHVPVVTSAYVGSRAEGALVDGVNCSIFPVGDTVAAATALRVLVTPSCHAAIAAGGRALVERRYTREASVLQWREVLAEMMGRSALTAEVSNNTARQQTAPGRLAALLGDRAANAIRERVLPRRDVRSAGAEWPHAYDRTPTDDAFWRMAKEVDQRVSLTIPAASAIR